MPHSFEPASVPLVRTTGFVVTTYRSPVIPSPLARRPTALLAASEVHRMELLTGLLRGDGSVDARSGPRAYRKNGRDYIHQNAAASLSFWTSSPTLERQFLFLVQSLGIRSSIQRRRQQAGADIHLLGTDTVRRLAPVFADAKRERLARCF